MAFASGGTLGTGVSSTSASSFTLSTATNTLAAGDFAILSVSTDNIATVDGASSNHTGVSGGTGTWTKLGEYTNTIGGAANDGITVSQWLFEATGTVSTGTVITITLSGNVTDKASSLWKFTKGAGLGVRLDPDYAANPNPFPVNVDASAGFGTAAHPATGMPTRERLFFRSCAKEANSTTNLTPTASSTAITNARSRNNANAVGVWGEFRILSSQGHTSNPTLAVTGDAASLLSGLIEYTPHTSAAIEPASSTENISVTAGLSGSYASGNNLLVATQELSAGGYFVDPWPYSPVTCSVTANTDTAPDGTLTADTFTSTENAHFIGQAVPVLPNTQYTFSFYAKRGTATAVRCGVADRTLINGVTRSVDLVYRNYYSEINASTWTRVTTTFTTPVDCTTIRADLDRDPSASGSVILWGAQLNLGATATDYTPIGSFGVGGTAGTLRPRVSARESNVAQTAFQAKTPTKNFIRNSELAGSPSPNWKPQWGGATGTAAGLTMTVTGHGVDSGYNYVEWTVTGTGTTLYYPFLEPQGGRRIYSRQGDSWTFSAMLKFVGTTAVPTNINLQIQEQTKASVFLNNSSNFFFSSLPTSWTRVSVSRAVTDSRTEIVTGILSATSAASDVINFVVRVAQPQLERGLSFTSYEPTECTETDQNNNDILNITDQQTGVPAAVPSSVVESSWGQNTNRISAATSWVTFGSTGTTSINTGNSTVTFDGSAAAFSGVNLGGTTTAGSTWVEFTVTGYGGGSLQAQSGNANTPTVSANGTYAFEVVSVGGSNTLQTASAGFIGVVSNISIKASATVDAPSAQAGFQSSYEDYNLARYSEAFDSWGRTNSFLTADATTAPNGTTTADLFYENTSNSTHVTGLYLNPWEGQLTFSIYCKAGPGARNVYLTTYHGTIGYGTFDPTGGTWLTGPTPGGGAVNVGNGWWRIWLSGTFINDPSANNGTRQVQVWLMNGTTSSYTGDGASGVYLWGFQVNPGLSPLPYQVSNTATPVAAYANAGQTALAAFQGVAGDTNRFINTEFSDSGAAFRGTGWGGNTASQGVTITVVGAGTELGYRYLEITVSGTNSGAEFYPVLLSSTITMFRGETLTASVLARLTAGALGTASLYQNFFVSGQGQYGSSSTIAGVTSSYARYSVTSSALPIDTTPVDISVARGVIPVGWSGSFTIRLAQPLLNTGTSVGVYTPTSTGGGSQSLTVTDAPTVAAAFQGPIYEAASNVGNGTELVTNGTFTSNTTGWVTSGNCTIASVGGEAELTCSVGGAGWPTMASTLMTGLTVGKTYVLSATARQGTTTAMVVVGVAGADSSVGGGRLEFTTTSNVAKSINFVARATSHQINCYINNGSVPLGATAYFDNISFQESSVVEAQTAQTAFQAAIAESNPNLVTNGSFDSDTTGWTALDGTLAVVNGAVRVTNTVQYGAAVQTVPVQIGKTYNISYSFRSVSGGNVQMFVRQYGVNDPTSQYAGTQTTSTNWASESGTLVAETSTLIIRATALVADATPVVVEFNDISIREVTLAEAANAVQGMTAHTDSYRDCNLWGYSEQIGDTGIPGWTLGGTSAALNSVTAPDGTLTATRITVSSALAATYRYTDANNWPNPKGPTIQPNTQYTVSWYVQRGTMPDIKASVVDTTGGGSVDIIPSVSIWSQTSASGWSRVSLTFTTPIACDGIYVAVDRDSGVTGTYDIWGMQLNFGPTALPYQRTTLNDGESAVLARHSDSATAAFQSSYTDKNLLANSVWAGGTSGTMGAGAVAPTGWIFPGGSGTVTFSGQGARLVAASQLAMLGATRTLPAGTYTQSLRIDAYASGTQAIFDFLNPGNLPGDASSTYFNNGSTVSGSVVPSAGDVIAVAWTFPTGATSIEFRFGLGTTGVNTTGDVTLSQPQLEVGAVPTSYDPTYVTTGRPALLMGDFSSNTAAFQASYEDYNLVNNSEFSGAVNGTTAIPGTNPTHLGTVGGVTYSITGNGVEDGMRYVELTISGTTTDSVTRYRELGFIVDKSVAGIPAAIGETYTGSLFVRYVGTPTYPVGTTPQIQISEMRADGFTFLTGTVQILTGDPQTYTKYSVTRTLSNSLVERIRFIWFCLTNGNSQNINIVVRLAQPQVVKGASEKLYQPTYNNIQNVLAPWDSKNSQVAFQAAFAENNRVRNSAAIGGAVGTLPTFWESGAAGGTLGTASGITFAVSGVGVEDGFNYVEYTVTGTNNSGSTTYPRVAGVWPGVNTAIPGESISAAFWMRFVGTPTLPSLFYSQINTSAPFQIIDQDYTPKTNGSTWTQVTLSGTVPFVGSTQLYFYLLQMEVLNGQAVNFTVRVAHPQINGSATLLPYVPTNAGTLAIANEAGTGTAGFASTASEVIGNGNLITNGSFDSASNWTVTVAGWNIVNGRLEASGANAQVEQANIPWIAGKTYCIEFDYNITVGNVAGYRGQGTQLFFNLAGPASGRFTGFLIASGGTAKFLFTTSSTSTTAWIDNVSVRMLTTAEAADSTLTGSAGSTTENVAAVDSLTSLAAFASATQESGASLDGSTATAAFQATRTEAGAANDLINAIAAFASAQQDNGGAADAITGLVQFVASRTEAAGANEQQTVLAAFVSAMVEAAASLDTTAGSLATAVTRTEAATSNDSIAALATFFSTRLEAGAIQDLIDSTLTTTSSVAIESASANSTQTALAAFLSALTEAAAGVDVLNGSNATTATRTEASTANDSINSQAAFFALAQEAGAASDTIAGLAAFLASRTEAASSVETLIATGGFQATLTEFFAAAEILAQPVFSAQAARTEAASSIDSSNALLNQFATRTEVASAVDSVIAGQPYFGSVTESGNSAEQLAVALATLVTQQSAVSAAESSTGVGGFQAESLEFTVAIDSVAGWVEFAASLSEELTAFDNSEFIYGQVTSTVEALSLLDVVLFLIPGGPSIWKILVQAEPRTVTITDGRNLIVVPPDVTDIKTLGNQD